jgi:hypothetical protein
MIYNANMLACEGAISSTWAPSIVTFCEKCHNASGAPLRVFQGVVKPGLWYSTQRLHKRFYLVQLCVGQLDEGLAIQWVRNGLGLGSKYPLAIDCNGR